MLNLILGSTLIFGTLWFLRFVFIAADKTEKERAKKDFWWQVTFAYLFFVIASDLVMLGIYFVIKSLF